MHHIYIIQNQINLKIYIGQTKDIKRRWKEHRQEVKNYLNPNSSKRLKKYSFSPLYKSMAKNGIENFSFQVIESFDTLEEINEAEEFWIQFFQSNKRDLGYNLSLGGNNREISEETRRKMSEQRSGENAPMFGKTHTPEARQKMSEALTGRKLSPEHCQKISEINTGEGNPFFGREHTEETKQKIAAVRTGTKASAETRQKMSEQRTGENNGMFGNTHTPEARQKIATAQRENIKTRPRDSKGRLIKVVK